MKKIESKVYHINSMDGLCGCTGMNECLDCMEFPDGDW